MIAEGATLTSQTSVAELDSTVGWQANPHWFWHQLSDLRSDFLGLLLRESIVPCEIRILQPIPGQRFLLVNSPELAHEVLISRANEFRKSHLTRKMIGKFLGNGLIVAEGAEHSRIRQAMMPLLNGQHLNTLAQTSRDEFASRIQGWARNEKTLLFSELQSTTFSVFLNCFIGNEPCAPIVADEFASALRQLGVAIGSRFTRMPLPDWLPTKNNRADKQAIASAREAARKLLVSNTVTNTAPTSAESSLLGHLRAQVASGNLSGTEAIDQTLTLLFAGHETMAVAFFWTFAYLATHPELQTQLREKLIGEQAADESTVEPFIIEVLRLYPPAWLFDRGVTKPTKLGGGTVKPGDVIYISPYTMQRNPIYFAEPNKFKMNRFANYAKAMRGSNGSYLPFGFGARSCVGQRLAMSQLVTVVAASLKTHTFSTLEPLPLPKPAATLQPLRDISITVSAI
jgi:cytochrome P450